MKRTALLGAVLGAGLAVTAALLIPAPAQALLCCVSGEVTSQYWAMAPTCAEAQTAYRALARPEANAVCGSSTSVCAFSIPPCEDNSASDPANPWKIDGTATFGCKEDCGGLPLCSTLNGTHCTNNGATKRCKEDDGTDGYCTCENNAWVHQ